MGLKILQLWVNIVIGHLNFRRSDQKHVEYIKQFYKYYTFK